MRFAIVVTVHLEGVGDKEQAERAIKSIYSSVWDAVPYLPAPAVTAVLFDGKGAIHKIEADEKIRRPR